MILLLFATKLQRWMILLGKLRKAKESTMSQRSRTCEPNLFYLVIEFYGMLYALTFHLVEFKIVNISYNAVFVY